MTGEFGSSAIKMTGSLILILGLIICLAYWVRRVRTGSFAPGRAPVMKLIGTLHLAPKRAVALIEVCDQWLLVGLGTESVTLISQIEPPAEIDRPEGVQSREAGRFQAILQNKAFLQPWRKTSVRGQDE